MAIYNIVITILHFGRQSSKRMPVEERKLKPDRKSNHEALFAGGTTLGAVLGTGRPGAAASRLFAKGLRRRAFFVFRPANPPAWGLSGRAGGIAGGVERPPGGRAFREGGQ